MLSPSWKTSAFYSEKRPRILSARPTRNWLLAAVVFSLTFVSLFHFRHQLVEPVKEDVPMPPSKPQHPELVLEPEAPRCGGGLDVLKDVDMDITAQIKYYRRCIRPIPVDRWDRTVVHNSSKALVPPPRRFREVELNRCVPEQYRGLTDCDEVIQLEVPRSYPQRQYPEFLFAIATSFERVQFFRPAFNHWLAHSGAQLIVTVVDGEEGPTSDEDLYLEKMVWEAAGMNVTFIRPQDPEDSVSQVHMMMLQDAVDAATDDTKWIGILDDDTFFPHFYPLWKALKAYDPSKPYYIGAPSEQLSAIAHFGMNAFGGAGVFVSLPLARQIAPISRDCLTEKTWDGRVPDEGDTLLAQCIYHHSHVKLTWLHGLWQLDIHGDPSGFFEGGRNVISLHHWKKESGWAPAPVVFMSRIANFCGSCFLARWRMGPKDVMTAGYSIVHYPQGNDRVELDKMEGTFDRGFDYDHALGPLRDNLEGTRLVKKSYRLGWSGMTGKGVLREVYVFTGDREKGEKDEVIDVLWDPRARSNDATFATPPEGTHET